MNFETYYHSISPKLIEIDDTHIALRKYGRGPNLCLIHGFPTHGYTWRKILPSLAEHFTCYVVDLPGLGDSKWTATTDFKSEVQADRLLQMLDLLKLKDYSLIAHDSGATVARIMALKEPKKVKKMVLFNTEISNHRPPWIPLYQAIALLPLVPWTIRQMLKSKLFVRSPMGFKEFYSDKSMLNNPINVNPYLQPLIASKEKTAGAFRYLKGIDWTAIDGFETTHKDIQAETLLLWGMDDKTFPFDLAKAIPAQFKGNCSLEGIKGTSLLPHEEKPVEVGERVIEFLRNTIQ